jgi:hypothetical protein
LSVELPRPCELSDVLEIATDYEFGWGPPLGFFENTDWSWRGDISGFDPWGVVLTDSDWNSLPTNETVRYVLVHDGEQWELRWGQVSREVLSLHQVAANREEPLRAQRAQAKLNTGLGTHRLMFSMGEARRAEESGRPIKSGYVLGVQPHSILMD